MAETANINTAFDTGREHLATVYAKALLGASEKAGNTDVVLGEFVSFVTDVLDRLPRLEASLASPRVPFEAKERMLNTTLGGKMTQQLLNFLKVVCRHSRFDCLRAILASAQRQYNDLRGRLLVHVRTAEPLDDAGRETVAAKLRQSLRAEVDLKVSVDPSLVGGIVIRVGDTVYDGSLAFQLTRLRDEALEKAAQRIKGSLDRFVLAE